MDAALTIRTAPPPPGTAVVRAGSAEPKTVLAPARTVGATGGPGTAARDAREKKVEIDPETRDVIYRLVDSSTGTVVSQTPSEAILNVRAYVRDAGGESSVEKTA